MDAVTPRRPPYLAELTVGNARIFRSTTADDAIHTSGSAAIRAFCPTSATRITWRTTVAHRTRRRTSRPAQLCGFSSEGSRRVFGALRGVRVRASGRSPPRPLAVVFLNANDIASDGGITTPG
jgi:hypothetical protein